MRDQAGSSNHFSESDLAVDIAIVGGGPTGLGAAWRLENLDTDDRPRSWCLFDRADTVGGMAGSVESDGFTWDLGGHVLFPHFEVFDELLDDLVDDWHEVVPKRGAWMWGRFIPYPVQRNVRHLPQPELKRVIDGFSSRPAPDDDIDDFDALLRCQFGHGLVESVLRPLNRKMWATDPSSMCTEWTGHRSGSSETNVPLIDVDEVLSDIEAERDRPAWGPSTRIRYPAVGGTGTIWKTLQGRLPSDRLQLACGVERIETSSKRLILSDGRRVAYQHLVSSMPLDRLLRSLSDRADLRARAGELRPVRTTVVGVGLAGTPPEPLADMCSLYLPEPHVSMWRLTVLSNYSPGCVPTDRPHWSLLAEVNRADDDTPDLAALEAGVVDDLESLGFIAAEDVVATWSRHLGHGYPVPLRGRDALLRDLHTALEDLAIYSRGRFGGWKYEVSNQDHAFMQGVEVVDRLVHGRPEQTFSV